MYQNVVYGGTPLFATRDPGTQGSILFVGKQRGHRQYILSSISFYCYHYFCFFINFTSMTLEITDDY